MEDENEDGDNNNDEEEMFDLIETGKKNLRREIFQILKNKKKLCPTNQLSLVCVCVYVCGILLSG